MIPICLVTGFLGSGKTTVLERLMRRLADRRVVYLVNEFATSDIDGQRLAGSGAAIVSVPGGSIFCTCLVEEFVRRLREIAATRPAPDGLVVEASGIADPRVVRRLLDETGLSTDYRLARVVAICDPGTFLKLLVTLPSLPAQVEAADVALLNKVDLHDEPALQAVEAELHALHPGLSILRCAYGEADFEPFLLQPERELAGELAHCADPRYLVSEELLPGLVELPRLEAALAALGERLYRAKGFVETAQGWRYVDWAAGRLTITRPSRCRPASKLVMICAGTEPAVPAEAT